MDNIKIKEKVVSYKKEIEDLIVKPLKPEITYKKEIEDHVKEIEEHKKHLEESIEKLVLDYDPDALTEIQGSLKELDKAINNLDEKLNERDSIIAAVAKSPIYIISPFARIKAMRDVGNAFDKAEETLKEAEKVIAEVYDAIDNFREALSDPYTRTLILARARRND